MGRKAKAKKERRQKKSEKKAEVKLGFLAKIAAKFKTKEKKPRKVSNKQILGGALTLIMLMALTGAGYLLFTKAFKPRPIAQILPAEETIAIMEINSNPNHNQVGKAMVLLAEHEDLGWDKIVEYMEAEFEVNFETDIEPWLGRVVGVAALETEESVETVYFAEVFSQTRAQEFDYEGMMIIDDYMFLSENEEVLKLIAESQDKLYDSKSYRRIDNNMPLNKTAFVFINFDKVSDSLLEKFPVIKETGFSVESARPLLSLFDSEGLSLVAMEDKFALQSFISLNREEFDDIKYSNIKKYTASLSEYVLDDTLAFWGGENLEFQVKRLLEALAGGDDAILTVFDTLVQNYTEKYFGPEVSFENDLLPLFSNEFALAIEGDNYKLVLELTEPSEDAVKIHEITDNFAEIGAVFEPKVVSHTLEDGTVTKEIIAVPEAIKKNESKYNDTTIYELKMGKKGWEVSYAFSDKVAIFSTSTQGIKDALDASSGTKESLRSSKAFAVLIRPVLAHSDEVSYFNMDSLLPLMFEGQTPPPFLDLISSISSGKNYFNDGITSINYLQIK